ncbi:MAG: ABC transporter ATP-binding protein [Bacilli bacterium]|nr:ABC transporter ATP-binding protein [Bacilli bacterium]
MIRLKNVSKYYYSKGVVATGFSKINLELNLGEFVAITGESGSGKTTLLNVISGLDTYEDGEMYINGEETSHYIEKDFEDYRRKNIGNIYQNFNLVNSYTVYQNIALVLMLNGEKNIKPRVLDLIKKVDLYKFRNTKVSKLSGGQKQRVAIARALAKDVPIIIADEPTGNLDKKSALSIMKLLSELSKDKLVIVVTHNYEQVKPYVTRKITMHDGRILEDVKLKDTEKVKNNYLTKVGKISLVNKIRLGFRNTFNVVPKFILLFFVFAFIVGSLLGEYSSFKKEEVLSKEQGNNYIFNTTKLNRIIVKNNDNSLFTEEQLSKIKNINNVDYIIENDSLLDETRSIKDEDNKYWIESYTLPTNSFRGELSLGRMPENDKEVIFEISKDSYLFNGNAEQILNKNFYYIDDNNYDALNEDYRVNIVGIKYTDSSNYDIVSVYTSDNIISKLRYQNHLRYSNVFVRFQGKKYKSDVYNIMYQVNPSNKVPDGEAFISESFNYSCPKYNCLWSPIDIINENLYFTDTKNLVVSKTYNKDNYNKIFDVSNYKKDTFDYEYDGRIFISEADYKSLFDKGTYQISVFTKDKDSVDNVSKELDNMNYKTLKIKDTLVNDGLGEFLRVIKTVVTIILVITLFFISYFIIKIILKSRNSYYSIIRMLGGTKSVTRDLLLIELFVVANIAFFLFMLLIYLDFIGITTIDVVKDVYEYLTINDYILLYLIITGMSILSSLRYSRKLFKNSVMVSFREEV